MVIGGLASYKCGGRVWRVCMIVEQAVRLEQTVGSNAMPIRCLREPNPMLLGYKRG